MKKTQKYTAIFLLNFFMSLIYWFWQLVVNLVIGLNDFTYSSKEAYIYEPAEVYYMLLPNQFHTEYHRVTLSHTIIPIPRGFLVVENSKTAQLRYFENSCILKIFGRNLVESRRLKSW